MKILSSFTPPNLHDFFFYSGNKRINFEHIGNGAFKVKKEKETKSTVKVIYRTHVLLLKQYK